MSRPKKKQTRKRKKENSSNRSSVAASREQERNRLWDTLRGVAILLMIVDHAAQIFADLPIEVFGLRFWTRLSMPLFCVLAGRLLAERKANVNWRRLGQVTLAAAIVNAVFVPLYGQVEILASLLVVFLVVNLVGAYFQWAIVSFLLFSFDPLRPYFDFPLCAVSPCVAAGMILGRLGWHRTLAISLVLASVFAMDGISSTGFSIVTAPTVYVFFFLPLAVALVSIGDLRPRSGLRQVEWIGRHPLIIYVAQYLILVLLSELIT